MDDEDGCGPRIVAVGPCAAGKTTLVNNLSPKGYNIRSCAQEHSFVPQLWQRYCRAQVLVYLDAELPTITERQQRTDWTQRRLDKQRRRLAHARAHCDLYLPTDDLTRQQVAESVEAFLQGRDITPDRGTSHDH
jgi:shikimate kinase